MYTEKFINFKSSILFQINYLLNLNVQFSFPLSVIFGNFPLVNLFFSYKLSHLNHKYSNKDKDFQHCKG